MRKAAANELLSAYLDGELSEVESAEVEQQLQSDHEMRQDLETLRDVVSFLQTHGPVKAPPSFFHDVLEAVEQEPMPQAWWWAWLRKPFGLPIEGLAVAVAAAVVLFVAWPTNESIESNLESATKPVAAQPSPTDPKSWQSEGSAQEMVNPQTDNDGVAVVDLPEESKKALFEAGSLGGPLDEKQSELLNESKSLTKEVRGLDALNQTGEDFEQQALGDGFNEDNTAVANTATPSWHGVPFMYAIRTDDPEALLRLHRLAGKHSGKVTDGKSRVKTAELQPGLSSFYVDMPVLELNGFEAELFELGLVQRYDNPNEELIYSEGEATLRIDLQLVEAAPQGTSAAQEKPAAKRKMLDAYEQEQKQEQNAEPAEALHLK